MATTTTPEPRVQVWPFGFRDEEALRIDPTPIARFLLGLPVELNPELAAAILTEFKQMERYRTVMLSAISKACGTMLQHAFDNVAPIEHPVTDVAAAYWRGYAQGKYEAYSVAAAELSEIGVIAALAVEPEGDDDTTTTSPPLG